jgi:hypothetical protein
MKSMIRYSGLLAAALCGGVLAGCNAVEDVRDEPFTPIPTQEVVLEGTIYGLGSRRSLVLLNNGETTRSFLAPLPQPAPAGTDPDAPSTTLFAFGNVKLGSPYNITVKTQPYGKTCTVNNPSGIIGVDGASPAITINCVNSAVPRFSLTVSVPNSFLTLQGAKVTLTTEEAVKEISPTTANTTPSSEAGYSLVTFPNALFTNPAGTALFDYTVSASTLEGGVAVTNPNRCGVTNAVNTVPVTANVGIAPQASSLWPRVQPCTFTIGGNVGYTSLPVGPNTVPAISGLVLQLRDKAGAPLQDLPIPAFTPSAPAAHTLLNNATTGVAPAGTQAYTFTYPARSNQNGIYEVVVLTHPTGQHCVVSDSSPAGGTAAGAANPARPATAPTNTSAGGVTLYQTSRTGIPVNISNMNIRCRVRPALANQLIGTYFVTRGDRYTRGAPTTTSVTTGTAPNTTVTSTTVVNDTTVTYRQSAPTEFGCSNASFHVNATTTQPVTTTVEVRTNPGNVLQSTTVTQGGTATNACDANNFRVMVTFFNDGTFLLGTHGVTNSLEHGFYYYDPVGTPADGARLWLTLITDTGGTGSANPTNGFGSFPGYETVNGLNHLKMYNVVKTATVPPSDAHPRGTLGTITTRMGAAISPVTNPPGNWATVVMTEAFSLPAQMTGSWVTRDHRRVWNYDFNSTYGYHVGVNGGSNNLQEACYTLNDYTVPSGFYTRRNTTTGCFPVGAFAIGAGTIDAPGTSPTVISMPIPLPQLPGFVGRMPGSETSFDGRATSPIYYHIAPPASFFAAADPEYFQTTDLSWCTTEVMGVAASLNNRAIASNPTVYFCRQGAN